MELNPDEVRSLKTLLEEWATHSNRELEATFQGASDTTTFLAIAQRLRAKGYTPLPQEDKMNILTKDQIRFTLTGIGEIERYCRENDIETSSFTAMRKDSAGVESNVKLSDYDVKVKVRREITLDRSDPVIQTLVKKWPMEPKAFRILRRWTFVNEEKGVRFDLSMVRSSPRDEKGNYKYQKSFKDVDITRLPATFEVEVELLRPEKPIVVGNPGEPNEGIQTALKNLIAGVGEVLRGIHKHTFLIRKSLSKKVLAEYMKVAGIQGETPAFRGVAPVTMMRENMLEEKEEGTPNIRNNYNVTDKADGLRMMGFVDSRGELFMIDMSMKVYRTGLKREACRNSLLDGEFVTRDIDENPVAQFWLFDCYVAPEQKDVTKLPFYQEGEINTRHSHMQDWVSRWNEGVGPEIIPGLGVNKTTKILVGAKTFLFASGNDIFEQCGKVLHSPKPYYTDGLILTPNALPIPEKAGGGFEQQLKWKPAKDNTVDFLVIFDKDPENQMMDLITDGVKAETGDTLTYKSMSLYVGSELDPAFGNPRRAILEESPLPEKGRKRMYKPVLFNPQELPDPMASKCYIEAMPDELGGFVTECESKDPIQDKSIVECRYDASKPPGWRWIPLRVRYDKTERFQKGILGRTLNNYKSAESVWMSIHEPITDHMISTGSLTPLESELKEMGLEAREKDISKVYYDRKAVTDDLMIVRGLRDFHRLYVKEGLLLKYALKGGNRSLVDLACGQGGDLYSWIRGRASFVYGTDIAEQGIIDPESGIYRRYLNAAIKAGGMDKVPTMVFTIGSSASNLASGEAGQNSEEADIMRAVYGKEKVQGPIPKYVRNRCLGKLSGGADSVAIMFALHYFFENEGSLDNFLRNVKETLRIGGLFVGCCFDGKAVFDDLRKVKKNASLVGVENGAEVWSITKKYDAEDFPSDSSSLGMPISVKFISIGTEQTEYLVNFDFFKQKMAEIGCELLTPAELKELSVGEKYPLTESTQLFGDTHAAAEKAGMKFAMDPKVKQYSFYNRWFIFKRKRDGMLKEVVPEVMEKVKEVVEDENENEENELPPVPMITKPAVTIQDRAVLEKEETKVISKATKTTKATKAKPAEPLVAEELTELRARNPSDALQFYIGAKEEDSRWLIPIAPFSIKDVETGSEYPSVEHYIAAMRYKLASNKPSLAELTFGVNGTIHNKYKMEREKMKAGTPQTAETEKYGGVTRETHYKLLGEEKKDVSEASAKPSKYKALIDESKWLTLKDKVLQEALAYRYEHDARLRKILETARIQNKILVYFTGPTSTSDLGGKRLPNGIIEGQNKVGRILMKLAGFKMT